MTPTASVNPDAAFRAAIEALVRNDEEARAACAADEDCSCAYKDCYECGKWHNCTHTPYTELRALLIEHPAAPGDGLTSVYLGPVDDPTADYTPEDDSIEEPVEEQEALAKAWDSGHMLGEALAYNAVSDVLWQRHREVVGRAAYRETRAARRASLPHWDTNPYRTTHTGPVVNSTDADQPAGGLE